MHFLHFLLPALAAAIPAINTDNDHSVGNVPLETAAKTTMETVASTNTAIPTMIFDDDESDSDAVARRDEKKASQDRCHRSHTSKYLNYRLGSGDLLQHFIISVKTPWYAHYHRQLSRKLEALQLEPVKGSSVEQCKWLYVDSVSELGVHRGVIDLQMDGVAYMRGLPVGKEYSDSSLDKIIAADKGAPGIIRDGDPNKPTDLTGVPQVSAAASAVKVVLAETYPWVEIFLICFFTVGLILPALLLCALGGGILGMKRSR